MKEMKEMNKTQGPLHFEYSVGLSVAGEVSRSNLRTTAGDVSCPRGKAFWVLNLYLPRR